MKTVYIKSWGRHIPVSLTDPEVITAFTNCMCAALAKALNHITGCQMVGSDMHAGIMSSDGMILDIEGVHTKSEFEQRWGDIHRCNTTRLRENFYAVHNWKEAIPFARLLVREYL